MTVTDLLNSDNIRCFFTVSRVKMPCFLGFFCIYTPAFCPKTLGK